MIRTIRKDKICEKCNGKIKGETKCVCDFCKKNEAFMEIRGWWGSHFLDSIGPSDVLHLCDSCATKLKELFEK